MAPLPDRTVHDRLDRALQSLVHVAADELDAAEATGNQAAQEPEPERVIFAPSDIEPHHLPLPVALDANRDHDPHRDAPPAVAGLHKFRV